MAFKHGSKTSVWLGGLDLSPYLNNADLNIDVDTADVTTYQTTTPAWKAAIAGTDGSKVSFSGFYDPLVTDLVSSIGVDWSLTAGVLTYCPAGAIAIGDRARLVSIATTSYSESSPIGGAVAVKWDVMSSTAVGFGDVLHLLGADTNTTTGAEKDDTASSATGWTAHLHVISVTGGSWVIKLQDAAVTNTYTDLTGGAFTAATTKSAQRLQGVAGSTLRRFVRYVATRTGGSAGDSITFALAYSRNQ